VKFVSTRGKAPGVPFSEALLSGLAPDGGLYVPEVFPVYDLDDFRVVRSFPETATAFLRPFLEGDILEPHLEEICAAAFDFSLKLCSLKDGTSVLELFHGPTAAFKDFGARFLAECFERIPTAPDAGPTTILVATSGDTGAAVAAAFHRRPNIRVGVLYPRDGVSPRQERHLTCWDGNVQSFSVNGSFDDCQQLVKRAFQDELLSRRARLSSANSINVGRLLPQAAYYAASALSYRHDRDGTPGFVIPSGNMGNAVGAFWARRTGFPLGRIELACNANRAVPDWFAGGDWEPRSPIRTLANAMDVGNPSNMERLLDLYPERDTLLADAGATSVDDDAIRETIAAGPERWGQVWCPHTATAVYVRETLGGEDWVLVATAHPAKFDSIVEPLIGRRVELPGPLAELLSRPTRVHPIEPRLEDLASYL